MSIADVLHRPDLLREEDFIGGAWVPAADGRRMPVRDPATGAVIASVALGADPEARAAVRAAEAAYPDWRRRTARERAGLLRRWFESILAHQEDLARIMTAEQGKPLAEARGEIAYAASFIEWFAEEGKRVYGEIVPSTQPGQRIVVTREPIGVVAAITPWNFPAAMITRKVGPALAAGCTAVVKPAPQTPLSALGLARLAEEAGLPPGVLNVVTGDAEAIGRVWTADPVVRKLSFTGSTAVGRRLLAQCAPTVKRVSLELGGNAPFIVFDDADLDAAVQGAMQSKYRNAGQTCVCANRFLVQAGIHDAFAERLAEASRALRVGPGLGPEEVDQGPLIDTAALDKVEGMLADAVGRGARVLVGGKRHARGGRFFEPTVLVDVDPGMRVAQEEIFGPLAPIVRFETENDAIRLANATEYGLAAYFYSRDVGRIWRVGEALEYGIVGVNVGIISTEVAPFGGMKQSGIGREGSRHGIDEYLEIKYQCIGL